MPEIAPVSYLRTPKYTDRTPLSKAIERNIEARNLLLSDPLVELRYAKAVLSCSEATLRRMIRLGQLPIVRFSPRGRIRVRQSVLLEIVGKGATSG